REGFEFEHVIAAVPLDELGVMYARFLGLHDWRQFEFFDLLSSERDLDGVDGPNVEVVAHGSGETVGDLIAVRIEVRHNQKDELFLPALLEPLGHRVSWR